MNLELLPPSSSLRSRGSMICTSLLPIVVAKDGGHQLRFRNLHCRLIQDGPRSIHSSGVFEHRFGGFQLRDGIRGAASVSIITEGQTVLGKRHAGIEMRCAPGYHGIHPAQPIRDRFKLPISTPGLDLGEAYKVRSDISARRRSAWNYSGGLG